MGRVSDSVVSALREVHFKGKQRLLDRLTPEGGNVEAILFGARFSLDLRDHIQRWAYYGEFEREVAEMIASQLKPGDTFVDVGANIGYFTALGAQCVGSAGRVLAIEPSPYAHDRLALLVDENQLNQVRIIQAGLSDTPGELNLYLAKDSTNHAPTMVPCEDAVVDSVSVRTLDDVCEEYGIERIDLMKMDVEGYEHHVLEGAPRMLSEGRITAILSEFNEDMLKRAGHSSSDLDAALQRAGFRAHGPGHGASEFENRLYTREEPAVGHG